LGRRLIDWRLGGALLANNGRITRGPIVGPQPILSAGIRRGLFL
jgi:hypothetical protein